MISYLIHHDNLLQNATVLLQNTTLITNCDSTISDKKANKYQITKKNLIKLGVLGSRFCMGGGMDKNTST